MKRRVITGLLVAALAALVAAPAAFAATSSVRIEGSNYQVLPRSVVDEGKAGGFVTGKTVTVATLADDLAKVNSAADAARFGSTAIETPKQFQPIAKTTLHVGEKVYARSETVLINVDSAPSLGALTASRKSSRVVVRCTPSKKSTVRILLKRGSKQVGAFTAVKVAGTQTFTVRLTSSLPANATIAATVTAQDDWGRSVSKRITVKKR